MERRLGFLATGVLCLLSTFSSFGAPNLVEVTIQTAAAALPAGMTAILPAIYIKYSSATFQLLHFTDSVQPGHSESQFVYLPNTAQFIKPVIAFQDKTGSLQYWYCKQEFNLDEKMLKSQKTHLTVRVEGITPKVMKNNSSQIISCVYKRG